MQAEKKSEPVLKRGMTNRVMHSAVTAVIVLLILTGSMQAETLFTDDFNRDDVNVGENWDDNDRSGTTVESTTTPDPGGVLKVGEFGVARTRIIPTKTFQGLTYSQAGDFSGPTESNDGFKIEYQTPTGLTEIKTVNPGGGSFSNEPMGAGAEDTYIRISYTGEQSAGNEFFNVGDMSVEGTSTGGFPGEDIYFNQFTDDGDLANWAVQNASKSHSGTYYQFTTGSTASDLVLSRGIDTSDYFDLALLITGSPIGLESGQGELLTFDYSTDGGTSWNTLDSATGSTRIDSFVGLPTAAEDNPDFMLRARLNQSNGNGEGGRFDMVHLVGQQVPEPGSLVLLVLSLAGVLIMRRRRQI